MRHHRLEACRRLEQVVVCHVFTDEREARLWEIAENLHRAELTVQERAADIAEWVRLTETKQGEVSRQLDAKPTPGRPEGGVRAASRELGIGEVEARRAVTIDSIEPAAKQAARDAGLDDNQSALLTVARAPAADQVAAVHDIAAKKAEREAERAAALLRLAWAPPGCAGDGGAAGSSRPGGIAGRRHPHGGGSVMAAAGRPVLWGTNLGKKRWLRPA